ncbi:MAG: hypothetical protein JOZ82_02975, partial [Marmoricola sp.]|nr:hypothetical protein [Marmoricola sp.]
MTAPINASNPAGGLARADASPAGRPDESNPGDAFGALVQRALGRHEREPGSRPEPGASKGPGGAHRATTSDEPAAKADAGTGT